MRSLVRLGLWTAALVGAARALLAMRSPSLVVPLGSSDAFSDWLARASPADMAIGLLRLAALAAIFYLLAVTALAVVAQAGRIRGLALAVDRITPAVVRRVVTGGSSVGLVLGGLIGSLPSPAIGSPTTAAAMATAPVDPGGGSPATAPVVANVDVGSPATAAMVRLPDAHAMMTRLADTDAREPGSGDTTAGQGDDPATTQQVDAPPLSSATMTRLAPPSGDGGGLDASQATPVAHDPALTPPLTGRTWTVSPGDSLWSIAEGLTTRPDGSPADERTVARYWRALIDANRADLVDPGNPDLLLPGQHLTLPPA